LAISFEAAHAAISAIARSAPQWSWHGWFAWPTEDWPATQHDFDFRFIGLVGL
jgi:hypothetical protein